MLTVETLADRLDAAADALTTVNRSVPHLTVPAGALGADDAGVPGRIGRRLHARWEAALTARAREAADTAGRVADLATAVRATARSYVEADESVANRVSRER